jgi:hypothetical protein
MGQNSDGVDQKEQRASFPGAVIVKEQPDEKQSGKGGEQA